MVDSQDFAFFEKNRAISLVERHSKAVIKCLISPLMVPEHRVCIAGYFADNTCFGSKVLVGFLQGVDNRLL